MALSRCTVRKKDEKKTGKPVNQDVSLKESVFHGSAAFPAAIYDDDLSMEEVIWHWHEEFEAGWITEGSIIVEAGNIKALLKKGQGFFINSGFIHAMRNADPGKPAGLRSIVFHQSIIAGVPGSIFEQKYILPVLHDPFQKALSLQEDDRIITYLQNAWNAMHSESDNYPLTVRDELSAIFADLAERTSRVSTDVRHDAQRSERTQIMLETIHAQYDEDLSLEEIAASANVSVSEALRCFHEVLGSTPVQYLKKYRLARAAQMLRETDESVSDILSACGFSDGSYFSRSFRKVYQCNPQEYRNLSVKKQIAQYAMPVLNDKDHPVSEGSPVPEQQSDTAE